LQDDVDKKNKRMRKEHCKKVIAETQALHFWLSFHHRDLGLAPWSVFERDLERVFV
jgi:hypothetical protein